MGNGLIGNGVSDPENLEEKFKKYVLQDLSISKGKKQKKLDELKESTDYKVAWKLRGQYETLFYKTIPPQIAQLKLQGWEQENKDKKNYKDDPELLSVLIETDQNDVNKKITELFNQNAKNFDDYIVQYKKTEPKKTRTVADIKKTMQTLGTNLFNAKKAEAQALAKMVYKARLWNAKLAKLNLEDKFKEDDASEKLAELPMKIEEEIERIKKQLDMFLGKAVDAIFDPNDTKFDLDILIAKMNKLIAPVMACISPLESVGGSIPILGDLGSILGSFSKPGDTSGLTKEDIKKLVGDKKPEIPQKVLDDILAIKDDIMAMCMQFPLMLITVIFEMINVIYSKLKIITSVIPLGSFFPLNLIDAAITATPKIITLSGQLPTLMYAMVKGKIKDQLACAMARAVPQPNITLDTLESLIPEVVDSDSDTPAAKSKPDKDKLDFRDVNKQFLPSISAYGFDMQDLNRILYQYKKIYDGSKTEINEYSQIDDISGEYYATWNSVLRTKANSDEYKDLLTETFSGVTSSDLSVNFYEVKDKKSLVGSEYIIYRDDVDNIEPGPEVAIKKMLEP